MSHKTPLTTSFSGTERIAIRDLKLPDDLDAWVRQNAEMIDKIQAGLNATYDRRLTEDQLWEIIAAAAAPEWVESKSALDAAETAWTKLHSPEEEPLGLIGSALQSDKTNPAAENFIAKLSDFTVINEGLRQRPDLASLLKVLSVQMRLLDQSKDETIKASLVTEAFAEAILPSGDTPRPPRIGLFKRLARKWVF